MDTSKLGKFNAIFTTCAISIVKQIAGIDVVNNPDVRIWTPPVEQVLPVPNVRRECIFGFLMETLSPNPQCIRTSIPIWVDGLKGPQSGVSFLILKAVLFFRSKIVPDYYPDMYPQGVGDQVYNEVLIQPRNVEMGIQR